MPILVIVISSNFNILVETDTHDKDFPHRLILKEKLRGTHKINGLFKHNILEKYINLHLSFSIHNLLNKYVKRA